MLIQLLEDFKFKHTIAHLKSIAPVYPEIEFFIWEGAIWGTTKVEFEYNGIRFSRHHVDSHHMSFHILESDIKERVRARISSAQEQTVQLAVPCQFDDVIGPTNTSTQNSLPPQKQIESER